MKPKYLGLVLVDIPQEVAPTYILQTYLRGRPMPGMFGADPPLMLIAIVVAMVTLVVFALMSAGY